MASLPFGLLQAASQSPTLSPCFFSFSKSETLGKSLHSSTASLAISGTSSPSSIPAGMHLLACFQVFTSLLYTFDCLIFVLCFAFSVYCGRGDKKTEKGKRFNHSYGNVCSSLFSLCFVRFLIWLRVSFLSWMSYLSFFILNFLGGKCSGKASGQDERERDSESTKSSFSA